MAKTTHKQKTAPPDRSTRTRRLKKEIARIVGQRRDATFNEAFALAVKVTPKGNVAAVIRWFNEAWMLALRRGAP